MTLLAGCSEGDAREDRTADPAPPTPLRGCPRAGVRASADSGTSTGTATTAS
ncbi:hypothetical protein ACFQ0Q_43540 [Streptomyces aureus]